MTDLDSETDSRNSYAVALAALRMRAVVNGDVLPREDEPVDLLTLRAVGEARGA